MSIEPHSNDDNEAYFQSLGFGDYWPEELEPQAASMMTKFAIISRLATARAQSGIEQPEQNLRIAEAELSMDIGILLLRKIRPSYLKREAAHARKITEPADSSWQEHEGLLGRAAEAQAAQKEAAPPAANTKMEITPERWGLTDRELEVFKLLPIGLSNADISRRLEVSEPAISVWVRKIQGKTGQDRRVLAATLAYETYKEEIAPMVNIDLSLFSKLTPLERDLLPLFAQGLSNEEIAAQRHIDVRKIKSHAALINRKLGTKRAQLGIFTVELRRAGLIETDELPEEQTETPPLEDVAEPPVSQTSDLAGSSKPAESGTKHTVERPLREDVRVKSLAINATRKVLRIINNSPEADLMKFADLRFSINVDDELLEFLHRAGFISAEEMEEGRLGYIGTAAAIVMHGAGDGRKLLGRKENRAHFSGMVKKEIQDEIDRAKRSRLYRAQDAKKKR